MPNPNLDFAIASYKSNGKKSSSSNSFKSNLKWPTTYRGVTSKFGQRMHPVLKKYLMHKGVDLRASEGTTLYAPSDGKVSYAGYMNGYGKLIEIKHSNGYSTRMAHNSVINVKVGQYVKKGQVIGKTGKTRLFKKDSG